MAPTTKPTRRQRKSEFVHQFLVVLTGEDPLVWRRIQVPQRYSFWDLHVAIQDAMGWKDYHLHEFRLFDEVTHALVSIGIPTGEKTKDRPVTAGWDVPVSRFFGQRGRYDPPATYVYDFGDDWQHVVVHEGLEPLDESLTYPRCVTGEGRCPPEDCGGVHGYAAFLAAIADPDHEEHGQLLEWAGGAFDPEGFDRAAVRFDDPKRRWRNAFGSVEVCDQEDSAPDTLCTIGWVSLSRAINLLVGSPERWVTVSSPEGVLDRCRRRRRAFRLTTESRDYQGVGARINPGGCERERTHLGCSRHHRPALGIGLQSLRI